MSRYGRKDTYHFLGNPAKKNYKDTVFQLRSTDGHWLTVRLTLATPRLISWSGLPGGKKRSNPSHRQRATYD